MLYQGILLVSLLIISTGVGAFIGFKCGKIRGVEAEHRRLSYRNQHL